MSNWTQPLCERCWIERNTTMTAEGAVVKKPTLLRDPDIEVCCICGLVTIFGCYIRINPATVPHPSPEKDD